eukprot:3538828-Rhodomonas_salina.2
MHTNISEMRHSVQEFKVQLRSAQIQLHAQTSRNITPLSLASSIREGKKGEGEVQAEHPFVRGIKKRRKRHLERRAAEENGSPAVKVQQPAGERGKVTTLTPWPTAFYIGMPKVARRPRRAVHQCPTICLCTVLTCSVALAGWVDVAVQASARAPRRNLPVLLHTRYAGVRC